MPRAGELTLRVKHGNEFYARCRVYAGCFLKRMKGSHAADIVGPAYLTRSKSSLASPVVSCRRK
jgi:hypothetical protein